LDEAQAAGVADAAFVHAGENYFELMDGHWANATGADGQPTATPTWQAPVLSAEEIKGRNMWIVWSGGNDRFWDYMSKPTFGAFDILKIVAGPPGSGRERSKRWANLGLINEPCFSEPTAPDANRFGLWLDVRSADCPPDPFDNETKYPGVKMGARGKTVAVGSYYGAPTGIVGLRLFPNPDFDEKAKAAWDANRYYNDPKYYLRSDLVRPYRVGMSCGFCHVGPSPINPPADPANPAWENLSSTVGAQYMWVDRLFMFDPKPGNFMYQWVKTYRPGAMDTSLVSTDNINNPRTMNAVYNLDARMEIAKFLGHEEIVGGERDNKQLNDYVKSGPLTEFFAPPGSVKTPHVLKDGSDSVGVLGALNRVYINIGLYSEEWLKHFNAVVGGKPITPIKIVDAQRNSAYWRATEAGTPAMALFFLKAGRPDYLASAPGGGAYLTDAPESIARGRDIFAETCARCHSSKQPAAPAGIGIAGKVGPDYLTHFKAWWRWTQTPEFKSGMKAIAAKPDFLAGNYLSTDVRIPATLLRTNICSPLASNAIGGNIWDNFSSSSYKSLPSVGAVTVADPFTAAPVVYKMPAGGRGYTRPPSLVSIWSQAPLLLNNALGPYYHDPSVAARMASFDASIRQLLWPETRTRDSVLGTRVDGVIDRTTQTSQVFVPKGFVPEFLTKFGRAANRTLPDLVDADGNVTLGPIPKGTPVNLLTNLQPLAETGSLREIDLHYTRLAGLLIDLKGALIKVPKDASDEVAREAYKPLRARLLQLSKCPDFVVNRGHYFGTEKFNEVAGLTPDESGWGVEKPLSDPDKNALIAYLKTL
jgi:mono/diheme cytochrome c family protein